MTSPPQDTTRYSFMLDLALQARRSVLLTGTSGVGKTRVMQEHLRELGPDGYLHMVLNFSGQTTSLATQLFVEGKLEKKRKNRYSAPHGKHVLLFVDDVNMPQMEEYGAQPPIELLRQYQVSPPPSRTYFSSLSWRSASVPSEGGHPHSCRCLGGGLTPPPPPLGLPRPLPLLSLRAGPGRLLRPQEAVLALDRGHDGHGGVRAPRWRPPGALLALPAPVHRAVHAPAQRDVHASHFLCHHGRPLRGCSPPNCAGHSSNSGGSASE